ncbi:Hsp70 family protein [Virgisporangium ochraceum]|uniref:Chaperone protein DnaK n=1 Tax=Virgisporangium ochraceum TaxID=65505 RepID=A0A8J3ZMW6_9ACTN|nr:Hsp70 family protein [Virgisporangium ochraceum]GIJ67219.1 chaperone protein DnaK [Virgisporangium ochraceum]
MTSAYGIDFGTTNSVLARVTDGRVETLPLVDEIPAAWADLGFDRVLPSAFTVDNGAPVFGWPAKTRTGRRVEAVKRLLATDDVVEADGVTVPVEVAGALLLRQVRRRVDQLGGEPLTRAVVTIPANSRGLARARTKLAADLAGIEVLALINEPTAAALAHARAIAADQRVLVFDWGGGTLDVTVLQAVEGSFIERSSMGIQRLGGLDLDAALLAAVEPYVPAAAGWSPEERDLFRLNLELGKIQLSTEKAVDVLLPDGKVALNVARNFLENAIAPLLERAREPLEVCLRESPGRIDHLVMVGGSSRMPAVQRFVAGIVGVDPNTEIDPMTAIAEGAAIAAGVLQGTVTDVDFHVGAEHALGTVARDDVTGESRFSVLIGRNTKYPARTTQVYTPVQDFQEEIAVLVVEGHPDKPLDHEDNVLLADWLIPLPEKRPLADSAVEITYEYDVDGILHVVVRDLATGQAFVDEQLAPGAGRDSAELDDLRRQVSSWV